MRHAAARTTGHPPVGALALRGRAGVAARAAERARRNRGRGPGRARAHWAALGGHRRTSLHRRPALCGRSCGRRGRGFGRPGVRVTVTTAAPRRLVADLGADATILDAARRLAAADPRQDVVLVVPAGAPLTRNAAFLDVLNRRAGGRPPGIGASRAQARSLRAALHLRAFASLAALERHELDATEHLS